VVAPHRFQPPPSYAGVRSLLDLEQTVVLDEVALRQALADLPPGEGEPEDLGPDEPDLEVGPQVGPDDLGSRVTRRFFTLCENPRTRARTMKVLRSSADSAVGGRLLVAFLSRMVFVPALRSRRIDHATARVELACAQPLRPLTEAGCGKTDAPRAMHRSGSTKITGAPVKPNRVRQRPRRA
jgi:hypothetical protein